MNDQKITYVVYRANIPARRIFNLTDPGLLPEISELVGGRWWNKEYDELRSLIREMYIRRMDELTNHYTSLRESVKNNGFLNPIIITRGPLQFRLVNELPYHLRYVPDILTCEYLGGSRLALAHEMGIEIPCIVSDFTRLETNYSKGDILHTPEDVEHEFVDTDISIKFSDKGVYVNPTRFLHIADETYTMREQIIKRHAVVQEVIAFAKNWIRARK